MFGGLEQIDHPEESGFDGHGVVDVLDRDLLDGLDFDLAVLEGIALADCDLGAFPDADAGGDSSVRTPSRRRLVNTMTSESSTWNGTRAA